MSIGHALVLAMLEFTSPLSPAECLARLNQEVDARWKLFGSRPVIGATGRSDFTGYKRISYSNSFRTIVFAQFQECGPGSRIQLRFGMSSFTIAFLVLWFGGVLLSGTMMMVHAVSAYWRHEARPETWVFVAAPLAMAGFGLGLVKFGRWLGRDEPAFLTDFLQNTLEATKLGLPEAGRGSLVE